MGPNSPDPAPTQKLDFIINHEVRLNPSGYAPLSAIIDVETEEEVRISLRLVGKDGTASDVHKEFPEIGTEHHVPVHGLYGNTDNTVELSFFDATGTNLGAQPYTIRTQPHINDLPLITLQHANRSAMAEGMTLVSYFGYFSSMFPQRPFIFDSFGKIRWYLDFQTHPNLNTLFYDDGMERLANGNFYFGSGGNAFGANADNRIYEIDLFGNVVNNWEMPGYGFHHEVFEKSDGNFLVTVNKFGEPTIEDYIIEIDRNTGDILREWNLNESLENSRSAWTTDSSDWFHANAVFYDASDDTIVVSGRTQGVVKLTSDNEVVWILAPHRGWGLAGNGQDLNQYLLQPLNLQGEPISDMAVLDGVANHPDFEWAWYQHAPELLPNGDLLLFDNGDSRNFSGNAIYSRAVTYRINPLEMTVSQQWQYGKERGVETYSRIVSDADYLAEDGHVLFSPGAIQIGSAAFGKSVEVDIASGEVLFEASILPPNAFFNIITFHRTERLSLYP